MNNGPVNSRAIMMASMILIGCLGAIIAGRYIAQGSYSPLIMAAAFMVGMTILLAMGSSYWLLIPLTSLLTGSLGFLPIPLNVAELGCVTSFGMFILYSSFKRVRFRYEFDWLDILLALNVAYVITVYLRNPIGFNFLGSDMVGGRPYFSSLIALLGYVVMRQMNASPKLLFWMPTIILVPSIFVGILNVITQIVPGIGRLIFPIYTGINVQDLTQVNRPEEGERLFSLGGLGMMIVQSLCSYFPPATLFHPSRFIGLLGMVTAFLLIGLSGFRSAIIASSGYVCIASFLRRRYADLFVLAAVAIFLLAVIGVVQVSGVAKIPLPIQRSLSFIPLGWDYEAIRTAEGSTEWRVKMWKEALTSDRIIRDKFLGDGFGMSKADMKAWAQQITTGGSGIIGAGTEELFLIRGAFHSGPVSSIKYVGYVGLLLILILQVYFAVRAYGLFRMVNGTKLAPMGMFVGIWGIYTLFEFYFIFGAYNDYIVNVFLYAGFLKLTQHSYLEMKLAEARAVEASQ